MSNSGDGGTGGDNSCTAWHECMGAVTAANSTRLPHNTSNRDTDSYVSRFNTWTA
jgi:hypothetical protein